LTGRTKSPRPNEINGLSFAKVSCESPRPVPSCNEAGPHHTLADWARPRNMYGKGGEVEANGRNHAPSCGCAARRVT
jgi:hypothetical protein